nr:MAG TPA: hypothetical protein [Caudoviricetes sp.]
MVAKHGPTQEFLMKPKLMFFLAYKQLALSHCHKLAER